MTTSARIGLAAALLLGGVTFAMAQNGPATGLYPPAQWNPNNYYGYYNYYATLLCAILLWSAPNGIRTRTKHLELIFVRQG